jgi:hypothetical protein
MNPEACARISVRAHKWLQAGVGLLEEQPATGPEGSNHGREGVGSFVHVDKHQAWVDQVEETLGGPVRSDVVTPDWA